MLQWYFDSTVPALRVVSFQQIQHPTAQLISRAAAAQDDIVGDGTSSTVVFIGELLKQAQRYLGEGVHPRLIADGFDVAKALALEFLDGFKQTKDCQERELLTSLARSVLRTKVMLVSNTSCQSHLAGSRFRRR